MAGIITIFQQKLERTKLNKFVLLEIIGGLRSSFRIISTPFSMSENIVDAIANLAVSVYLPIPLLLAPYAY